MGRGAPEQLLRALEAWSANAINDSQEVRKSLRPVKIEKRRFGS